MNPLTAATRWLENARMLDTVAEPVQQAARAATSVPPVAHVLSGRWMGHPLHPVLIHVPLGAWPMAALLDLARDEGGRDAADLLVAVGIAGYVPAALAGAHDWAGTQGAARRVGLVHAGLNAVALGLHVGSLVARRAGSRDLGLSLSLGGLAVAGVAGYLGGHLTYVNRIGTTSPQQG